MYGVPMFTITNRNGRPVVIIDDQDDAIRLAARFGGEVSFT